jgi:hypothetical protein
VFADGVYNHFRQDNLLSKALWGWDFRKLAMFKWSAYAELGAADHPKRSHGAAAAGGDVPSPDPLCSWEASPPPSGTVSAAMSSPLGTKRPRGDAAETKPAKRLAKRTAKRSAKATAASAGSPLLYESQTSEWRAVRSSPAGADHGGGESFDDGDRTRVTTTEAKTTNRQTAASQLPPSSPRSPWKPMPLRPIVLADPDSDKPLLEGQEQLQQQHQDGYSSAGCQHCGSGPLDLRPRSYNISTGDRENGDSEGEAIEVYGASGHEFPGAGPCKQARVRMPESERELAELQESGGCAIEQSVVRYMDEEGRSRCRLVIYVRSLVTDL